MTSPTGSDEAELSEDEEQQHEQQQQQQRQHLSAAEARAVRADRAQRELDQARSLGGPGDKDWDLDWLYNQADTPLAGARA